MQNLNANPNHMDEKAAAKAILVEIIRQSNGCFYGSTRLYKAFYFAHLYYYRENATVLSSWPVVRMPQGPGVESGEELVAELISDGLVEVGQRTKGPYLEDVFVLKDARVQTGLPPEAVKAIQDTLGFIKHKSATALSSFLHENSRTWNEAKSGDELNIYIDLMTEMEYQTAISRRDRIREQLGEPRSRAS